MSASPCKTPPSGRGAAGLSAGALGVRHRRNSSMSPSNQTGVKGGYVNIGLI